MPKRTLYVSKALEAEMAAVETDGECSAPDWSTVFAAAVRAELDRLKTHEFGVVPDVDFAVRRLRSSRRTSIEPNGAARSAGRRWGAEEAEWHQLFELQRSFGGWSDSDWRAHDPYATVAYSNHDEGGLPTWGPETVGALSMHVLRLIGEIKAPEETAKKDVPYILWGDTLDWWEAHGAGGEVTPEYVRAFVESAVSIYDDLRAEVEG